MTFPTGADTITVPAPPVALLRPGGYQGVMQAVIPHTLVIPRFIVVFHTATSFLCSVLGVASAGGGSLCLGVSPLDTCYYIILCTQYKLEYYTKYAGAICANSMCTQIESYDIMG